ncbi:MAG: TerB family tellurite resistance protein [Gammaproteobacteria bacterium]
MFASFVAFIEKNLNANRTQPGADPQQALRLAMAALCVEMARADMEEKPGELERAKKMLAQRFLLTEQEAQALIAAGETESDQSVSLYDFTHLLNAHLEEPGKRALLEMLWRVAYEDGSLDKYEDALMHKLAELLYVPIAELMLAKQRALALR